MTLTKTVLIKIAYLLGRVGEKFDTQILRTLYVEGACSYEELKKQYIKGWEEARGLLRNQ